MLHKTNENAVHELMLYTENDGAIYEQQTISILKNLAAKKARSTYDKTKAVALFMHLAEAGAKKYAQTFGGVWHKMFPVDVRRTASAAWNDEFETEYNLGNYNHLLPK